MAKKESIKGKSHGELTSMLVKQRDELRSLRFAAAGARPKDSAAPRKTRKEIARILTELHAQNSAVASEAA